MADTKQVGGAASGAATGAQVGSSFGPIGTAIGAVAGAVIGWLSSGGGGTYAVGDGYKIQGTVDATGFHGTYLALAHNGGESYADNVTAAVTPGLNKVIQPIFDSRFNPQSVIPVNISAPLYKGVDTVAAFLNDLATRMSDTTTTTTTGTTTTGTDTTVGGVAAPTIPATPMPPNSGGGSSTVAPAPLAAASAATGLPSWALVLLAIAGAYWLYKRAG